MRVINRKNLDLLQQKKNGTKFSPVYQYTLGPKETRSIYLRLSNKIIGNPFAGIPRVVRQPQGRSRMLFIRPYCRRASAPEMAAIQRQAFAGLLWSKQYYHFDVERWLNTSDGITPVNAGRSCMAAIMTGNISKTRISSPCPTNGNIPGMRRGTWHFKHFDGAWSIPVFAKHQLLLIMREWYMKPDGQIPAYEWNFSDVNPPVQAWAALTVYRIEKERTGKGGSWFSETDLSEAADQFHVVDQPKGCEWEQYVRRRLPWAGQYRGIQPQSFAGRGYAAGAGRRDELDGDVCAQYDGYGARDRDER